MAAAEAAAGTAVTGATTAAASAVDASTSAADAESAATRAEAIGGTNDTQTASFVNNPNSATNAALDLQYAAAATTGAKAVGQGELVINVRDEGAVGDGVTNDATAILAATGKAGLAIASGYNSAVVYFPWTPKGYICNSTISIGDRVTYRGERRVRIRHTAAMSAALQLCGAHKAGRSRTSPSTTPPASTPSPRCVCRRGPRKYTIRNCKFVGGTTGRSNPIVTKQVTANVATLTTDHPHGMESGSLAHLSGMPFIATLPVWDGDYTVLDTPTATTFRIPVTGMADSAPSR